MIHSTLKIKGLHVHCVGTHCMTKNQSVNTEGASILSIRAGGTGGWPAYTTQAGLFRADKSTDLWQQKYQEEWLTVTPPPHTHTHT